MTTDRRDPALHRLFAATDELTLAAQAMSECADEILVTSIVFHPVRYVRLRKQFCILADRWAEIKGRCDLIYSEWGDL
jgi:hypothetical protein